MGIDFSQSARNHQAGQVDIRLLFQQGLTSDMLGGRLVKYPPPLRRA
jgi:hypothetical protein